MKPVPTKVKVCGITRREDAKRALSLGADYLGINVYEKSPRSVSLEVIPSLLEVIPPGRRVLIDVSTPTDRLEQYLGMGFDAYQIHFDLDVAMSTLAGWSGLVGHHALWVAPRMSDKDIYFPQILMEFADTVLLDAYDKNAYGGTGKAGQNWQRFLDCTLLYQHKKWILAGGLGPGNIREALSFTSAGMVDVNSGVESAPGIKDPGKLETLFSEIRAYDSEKDSP